MKVFGGVWVIDRVRLSQFGYFGLAYIKACLDAVSGNPWICPLEAALKGDFKEVPIFLFQEIFL